MHSILRVIKFAFQDIWRNLSLSFMTVLILVLMLLSVNILWSVDIVTKEAVRLVKDQVNVSLYFASTATEKDISEIKKYLITFPEVIDIQMMDKNQVLESFSNRHKLSAEILQALGELGGNPFGSTVIVKTREPADYKKIIQATSIPEYEHIIEAKSYEGHESTLERLQTITNRIEKGFFWLCILFAVISFMIIFNTIRVSIYIHRTEISIKRLVGASNLFISGPYLIEALLFTVLSLAITTAVLYFALKWADPYLAIAFPNSFSLTNYYKLHILWLVGVQFVAVLLLTVFSSVLAMRRQLKV